MERRKGIEKRGKKANSRLNSAVKFLKWSESKRSNSHFDFVISNILPKSKRSQVTIFIIIALLILIILIVLFARTNLENIFAAKSSVQQFEDCARVYVEQGIEILSKQGGSINPENYYLYDGNKVEYVCYAEANLQNCVMQKPILKNTIEDELLKYSESKINNCLREVKKSLEKNGYEVLMKEPKIKIELIPDNILIDMNIGLKITKDGTENYENLKLGIKSKIYNSIMIASSIMAWETRFGDSETLNYMLYYPSIKVEKKKQGDSSKIYILTDRETEEKFMFAVRSFAIPPGVIEVR